MTVFNKLKQFRELRSQAKQVQHTLSQETIHVEEAGGNVQMIMDGNQKVLSLDIDPSLLSTEQKQRVEQALKDAFNAATKKVQGVLAQKVRSGELTMPDVSKLS